MTGNKFRDCRELADTPLYGVSEAARYIGVNYATLYSWLKPVRFQTDTGFARKPIIAVKGRGLTRMSFLNLVEAHVVKALRITHGVPLADIRTAVEYAERKEKIARLLVDERLMAGAKGVFIKELDRLINLGRSGQYAIEKVLSAHLERIEYESGLAIRLWPYLNQCTNKGVLISPTIAFGKPVVSSKAITTQIIVDRYDLGDSEEDLAKDYGIEVREVEEAILYERAA